MKTRNEMLKLLIESLLEDCPSSPDPTESQPDPPPTDQAVNDRLARSMRVAGRKVLIRTVAFYYTGLVVDIDANTILLDEAAWVADTGRFADALKSGTLNEVEPYPGQVFVNRASIIDWCVWEHDLPREQK